MGERDSLLAVQRDLIKLGQDVYRLESRCSLCQANSQEFWQRLNDIEFRVHGLSTDKEEIKYLRHRICRWREFGDSLDDLC